MSLCIEELMFHVWIQFNGFKSACKPLTKWMMTQLYITFTSIYIITVYAPLVYFIRNEISKKAIYVFKFFSKIPLKNI